MTPKKTKTTKPTRRPTSDRAEPGAKVALVTGGAKRVGAAIALRLAEAGYDVAITYNSSAAEAAKVVRAIEALGRRALAIRVDFAKAGCAEAVYRAFTRRFDRLDALVNNASTFAPSPLASVERRDFDANMAVNAVAPLMLIQKFAPMLRAHYDPADPASTGRVVNFIDIHVLGQPLKGYVAYNASKAALHEVTMTLALELAPSITVNAIAPGVVAWAESYTAAQREAYMRRVPLARPGTPADAAAAVLFLVHDAHYCTGQVIRLDGGRWLT
ncbi:MAG: SDR family oxidoreductase [Planctomycetes bacterium]|nr:SDR family oxidoreductase [Planctomycetota bacterium]